MNCQKLGCYIERNLKSAWSTNVHLRQRPLTFVARSKGRVSGKRRTLRSLPPPSRRLGNAYASAPSPRHSSKKRDKPSLDQERVSRLLGYIDKRYGDQWVWSASLPRPTRSVRTPKHNLVTYTCFVTFTSPAPDSVVPSFGFAELLGTYDKPYLSWDDWSCLCEGAWLHILHNWTHIQPLGGDNLHSDAYRGFGARRHSELCNTRHKLWLCKHVNDCTPNWCVRNVLNSLRSILYWKSTKVQTSPAFTKLCP